jgi:hypothetical protein
MRKVTLTFTSALIAVTLLIGVSGCNKDGDDAFEIVSLVAGNVDLNTGTPAVNVPAEDAINATFSVDIDAATVSAAVIKLVRDYDGAEAALTFTTAGKMITITPNEPMGYGTKYKLSFLAGIKAIDGQDLQAVDKTFTTIGTFVPAGMIAYWNFNDDPKEQVLGAMPSGLVAIDYTDSYKSAAGKAAGFNGTTSILEYANTDYLVNTTDFTLSFWVKAESANHGTRGHFVMGLGAFFGFGFEISGDYSWCKMAAQYEFENGTSGSEDLWFPGDGVTGANGGWKGWTYCRDLRGSGGVPALLKDKWASVVCVYNSETREGTMYINGEKMKAFDFDLWDEGDIKRTVKGLTYGGNTPTVVDELAFGFNQSRAGTLWDGETWGGYDFPEANHFEGKLDDVRIFHTALTEQEVSMMYAAEKP